MTACCLLPHTTAIVRAGPPQVRPLGTLLVLIRNGDATVDAAEIVAHWRSSPWCPIAAVGIETPEVAGDGLLLRLAMHVTPFAGRDRVSPSDLRAGIRSRRAPDATDQAAYLAYRHSLRLGGLYLDVLKQDCDWGALRRPLRRIGAWSPHDWFAIERTVTGVAKAIIEDLTEAGAAQFIGVDVKTLSTRCRRYFGRGWRELVALGAWEPALELALRAGGYVTIRQAALEQGGNEHN